MSYTVVVAVMWRVVLLVWRCCMRVVTGDRLGRRTGRDRLFVMCVGDDVQALFVCIV